MLPAGVSIVERDGEETIRISATLRQLCAYAAYLVVVGVLARFILDVPERFVLAVILGALVHATVFDRSKIRIRDEAIVRPGGDPVRFDEVEAFGIEPGFLGSGFRVFAVLARDQTRTVAKRLTKDQAEFVVRHLNGVKAQHCGAAEPDARH